MTSNTKRLIASFAALQILLYHCWIPVLGYGTVLGSLERFLVAATYPGVDIFFFLSAFSLVSRPAEDYWGFIQNRMLKILPLFFIALITGRFLWFIPSIAVLYLLLPPLYKICRKRPVLSFFLLLISWAGIVYLVLGLLRPKIDFGIFLFRIPVIILGAYAVSIKDWMTSKSARITGILLLSLGTVLIYLFGYINRLNVPYRGTFYLMGIPVTLGIVFIFSSLSVNRIPGFIGRFGSMTLELYFSQMVFGAMLVNLFFRLTKSRLLTNLTAIAVIILVSALIKRINDMVTKRLSPG